MDKHIMGRHRRISRLPRTALASRAALAAGALVPTIASVGSAHAATPQTAICTSDEPGLADKLSEDINSALDGSSATTAISLHDRTTNTTCTLDADRTFDSASTVKVTVLATLLWDAQKDERALTQEEKDRATAMITESDNDATTALWKQLGADKINGFLRTAGMTNTVLDSEGHWGLTQIIANDEEKLLNLVTHANPVLGEDSRAYILKLTSEVIPSQRWGTPAGAPDDAQVHVKNGWLERATNGWRVHSLGAFTGGDHDYTITVLSQDNATMDDGITNIEGIARAVHQDLNAPASSVQP